MQNFSSFGWSVWSGPWGGLKIDFTSYNLRISVVFLLFPPRPRPTSTAPLIRVPQQALPRPKSFRTRKGVAPESSPMTLLLPHGPSKWTADRRFPVSSVVVFVPREFKSAFCDFLLPGLAIT